jgi:MarR family transcriptional regulator for hemolysin
MATYWSGRLRSGSATQARLAEKLEIEPISVSRLIDRMEQAGWVSREADPADRRAKIIVPTEKAQASYETIRNEARGVISEALTGISNERQAILMECLQQLVTNLSTDDVAVLSASCSQWNAQMTSATTADFEEAPSLARLR